LAVSAQEYFFIIHADDPAILVQLDAERHGHTCFRRADWYSRCLFFVVNFANAVPEQIGSAGPAVEALPMTRKIAAKRVARCRRGRFDCAIPPIFSAILAQIFGDLFPVFEFARVESVYS
jgi:hypothetical protein